MKKYLISILFLLVSSLIIVPNFVYAQTTPAQQTECAVLKAQFESYGGGRVASLPEYCNTNELYSKITTFAYYIIGIAAVISLIYGGYMYMTASSNDSRRTKAKNIIMWTLAGLALAVLAGLIVTGVISLVVDNKFF
jgi:hypothetical protein